MTVYVDTRYVGHHGIARYAAEVTSRLRTPFEALPVNSSPTSLRSLLDRGWRLPGPADLVYSPGFGTGSSRARQLLTVHDLIHLQEPAAGAKALAHRMYYEYRVKPAIKRAGMVLTVSTTSADAITEWLADDSVKVIVTGNGCSPAFTPHGSAYDHSRPYVLWVGNVKRHKNPQVVMNALSRLSEFDLIAVTSDGQALRRMAIEAGVNDRMLVVADVSDHELATYYRGATALLLPSVLEGFGLPALEARSCGTPTVYFAGCASVAEIVGQPEFAVSDAQDGQAFAEAVVRAAATVVRPLPAGYGWESVSDVVDAAIGSLSTRAIAP